MALRDTLTLLISLTLISCNSVVTGPVTDASIKSLNDLAIETLRSRQYGSTIQVLQQKENVSFKSYLATYDSDGLRLYMRVDVPEGPAPAAGFPVLVFVHGWRGIDDAPSLDFYYDSASHYSMMIDAYRNAGFVVLVPGLRGHGSFNSRPADGIEYLAAWDNGSYLSPVFYAIDVLNLLDGLNTLDVISIDPNQVNVSGHSQGGDTTLFALAIAGEGSSVKQQIHAASIWSGTFPPRFTQLNTYAPMQQTAQAFMSGDGSWTGRATADDGSINPHFIFWYPADWIESLDPSDWTWQKESWSVDTVAQVLETKLEQMYGAINQGVGDIADASYSLITSKYNATQIVHDPRIVKAMEAIDAFGKVHYLTEPLALHYSDRDFYSFPAWNRALCESMSIVGNACYNYEYKENTHSLGVSKHRWFSSNSAQPGLPQALKRDLTLFSGGIPDQPD